MQNNGRKNEAGKFRVDCCVCLVDDTTFHGGWYRLEWHLETFERTVKQMKQFSLTSLLHSLDTGTPGYCAKHNKTAIARYRP